LPTNPGCTRERGTEQHCKPRKPWLAPPLCSAHQVGDNSNTCYKAVIIRHVSRTAACAVDMV
jgi:hypothetical protein